MCEYCEWQQDTEDVETFQDSGYDMYICNEDQLVVEDDSGVISSSTIYFCPQCGREL